MAWNRSSEKKVEVEKKGGQWNVHLRGLVAGAIVVLGAGLAVWLIWPSSATNNQQPTTSNRSLITEVTPAAAPKAEAKVRVQTNAEKLRSKYSWASIDIPDNWDKPYPPQAYWPDGTLKEHSRYVKIVTNTAQRAKSIDQLCFSNHAERDIARALAIRPGSTIVGNYEYGEFFVKSFLDSLKEPIVIDREKDTPAMQELKEMVIEAKKELKARYDAGEDIAAVMNETRKQLKELNLYRNDIVKMVEDAKRSHDGELTEADEKDLVSAANQMLEDRGCDPLVMPDLFVEQAKTMKPEVTEEGGTEE